MPRWLYPVPLLLLWLGALPVLARQGEREPGADTIRVQARSVVLDVVVTDKRGQPVRGLREEMFHIFEDGKPQAITSFEEHAGKPPAPPSVDARKPGPNAESLTPGGGEPDSPPPGSINLLLVDALNTPLADQAFVQRQMLKYLATIPPGTPLGILTLGERLRLVYLPGSGFTTGTSLLEAALASSALHPSLSPLLPNAGESAANAEVVAQIASMGPGSAAQTAAVAALQDFQANQASFALDQRMLYTLQALHQIARSLAGVPGRKNLMWFAGSFPLCISDDLKCPYQGEMEETVASLTRAEVSLYPIEASGLTPDSILDVSAPPNHALDANLAPGVSPMQGAQDAQTASLSADRAERRPSPLQTCSSSTC